VGQFADVATEQVYAVMAPGLVDDAATTKILRVRPQPDAVEALTMIREAGSWAVTLTNGAAERIRRLLEGSDGVLCGAELVD
jgi:hypothetical protein